MCRMIHLTNDAVQKKDKNYGKYESGNKLTFQELQQYIDMVFPGERVNIVQQHILPTMKYVGVGRVASDRQSVMTVLCSRNQDARPTFHLRHRGGVQRIATLAVV